MRLEQTQDPAVGMHKAQTPDKGINFAGVMGIIVHQPTAFATGHVLKPSLDTFEIRHGRGYTLRSHPAFQGNGDGRQSVFDVMLTR